MKKIGKISINPEKVIKNEKLMNLLGGYTEHYVSCKDSSGSTCHGFDISNCGDNFAIDWACWMGCGSDYSGYVCV